MAKKVARPARISVQKRESFRDFGCGADRLARAAQHTQGHTMSLRVWAHMSGSIEPEPAPNGALGDLLVGAVYPTHGDRRCSVCLGAGSGLGWHKEEAVTGIGCRAARSSIWFDREGEEGIRSPEANGKAPMPKESRIGRAT